jgi:hypothetical protein
MLQQLHFLFKSSKPRLSILLINIGCHFWAKGKPMTNEVGTKSRYVYGAGADALYQTNMVECHGAFQISR